MYERYYGLRERPFNLTSNPRYLLLTPEARGGPEHPAVRHQQSRHHRAGWRGGHGQDDGHSRGQWPSQTPGGRFVIVEQSAAVEKRVLPAPGSTVSA